MTTSTATATFTGMQFTISQPKLLTALQTVSRAVSQKTGSLPILSNVKLEVTEPEHNLILTATNLEISITAYILSEELVTVTEPGAITVPAKLLTDFVANIDKDAQVELTHNRQNDTVLVKSKKFQANINGITADDYPAITGLYISQDPVELITLPVSTLKDSLAQVVFAASSDESRPVLTGMNFKFTEGSNQLELACADSFRLALKRVELPNASKGTNTLIIPAKALRELISVLGAFSNDTAATEVTISVTSNKSQVIFQLPELVFTASLIEGTFPNYDQIIPKTKETSTVLDVKEAVQAVKVASLFAKDSGNNIVQLHLTESEATFKANAAQVGDNTTSLPATTEGATVSIALNAAFLRDALQAVNTQQVRLEIQTASNPAVVKPVNGDKAKEDYIVVVMPMHLATR